MMKFGLISIGLALGLNVACMALQTDYLMSVALVFGGVCAYFIANGWRKYTRRDLIVVGILIAFSDVMTLVIEKLMLYYDVWGFSNRHFRMIGLQLFGAPVEEFIYWWACPVVVALGYVSFLRVDSAKAPSAIAVGEAALLAHAATEAIQSSHRPDPTAYLENSGVAVQNDRQYERGSKKPTYVWLQVIILAMIAWFARSFKGSWKAVGWTVAVFVAIAYPNERYSLGSGFWTYNENKLLGIWILGVPVEEWIMYTICPLCACLMMDAIDRLVRKFGA